MKLAIMQPYFFPYIGYFQLLKTVDEFVIYDNIQFTKKGWIHRNRILVNEASSFVTLPLKNDSDYLDINDRRLADSFFQEKKKLLRRIEGAYRNAPYFHDVYPLVKGCLDYDDSNLFNFIFFSVKKIMNFLSINTRVVISSSIKIDNSLKAEKKVIEICKQMNAGTYINPIGGLELYDKGEFAAHNIELKFLKTKPIVYKQFNNNFIPWLSIIDVMMFNSVQYISELLNNHELI